MEDIDDFLKYEPKEQRKYLTLIPVVHNNILDLQGDKYKIKISVEIYAMEATGKIGKPLLAGDLECNGKWLADQNKSNSGDEVLSEIKAALFKQKQWPALTAYIHDHAKEFLPFPQFGKYRFHKEQSTHSFGQACSIFFNQFPLTLNQASTRIEKSNLYIVNATQNTNKMTFDFDLGNEVPALVYGYIIASDLKVRELTNKDVHIEKSPEAVPDDVYSGLRYLVVDLPGITTGSVVSYAIKYYDRAAFDSTALCIPGSNTHGNPLARDLTLRFSSDSTPWQLRVLLPYSSMSKVFIQTEKVSVLDSLATGFGKNPFRDGLFSPRNPYAARPKGFANLITGSMEKRISALTPPLYNPEYLFQMFLYEGLSTPLPVPAMEPLTYMEVPRIRVATETSWDSLYGQTRDSIFSLINHRKKASLLSGKAPTQVVIDSMVANLQTFFSDSLRYMHVSFSGHKTIPECPDTLLVTRMGDCKDFSTLFISELRSMGINAVPALVNASWPTSTSMTLPSYDAFDHMIVYVPQFSWWIDPVYHPLPPAIVPEYLTGLKSLVLFKDSARIMEIRSNEDSLYHSVISYEIKIEGQNETVANTYVASYEKSGLVRKYLPRIDTTRYLDFLFPADDNAKRYSIDEQNLQISGLDRRNGRVIIHRRFTARNTVTMAGGNRLLNLPEMPLFWFVSIVASNTRTSDLYFPYFLFCDVKIKLSDDYTALWPKNTTQLDFGGGLRVVQLTSHEIDFCFHVKKGIMNLQEYMVFKRAMDFYRNFFSNPIPIKRQSAKTAQGRQSL